jgi:hypothetical protein
MKIEDTELQGALPGCWQYSHLDWVVVLHNCKNSWSCIIDWAICPIKMKKKIMLGWLTSIVPFYVPWPC